MTLRGRFSIQNHRNFLEIALASVLKSAATADLATARGHMDRTTAEEGKALMRRIVSMLTRMQSGYDNP